MVLTVQRQPHLEIVQIFVQDIEQDVFDGDGCKLKLMFDNHLNSLTHPDHY